MDYFRIPKVKYAAYMQSIEELILNELKFQGKSINYLAKNILIGQSHLTRVLRISDKDKRPLSSELKSKIEAALGKEFHAADSSNDTHEGTQ
jgi:hypothetical protein